jgi:hypothetical protein
MAGGDLIKIEGGRALKVFDPPLPAPVISALALRKELRRVPIVDYATCSWPMARPESIEQFERNRNQWLPLFERAHHAMDALLPIVSPWACRSIALTRQTTLAMLTALYAGLGAKRDDEMFMATLDMFESDDIARALWDLEYEVSNGVGDVRKRWVPSNVTPAALALACRTLIATSVFPPKPAELRNACIDAARSFGLAYGRASEFCDMVAQVDAILLMNAHEQWERPYLSEQARPVLQRMLKMHEANYELCWAQVRDDEDERRSPFGLLVEQEKAKIEQALPPPKPAPKQITPPLPVQLPRRKRQTNKKRNPARQLRADVVVEPPKGELTS